MLKRFWSFIQGTYFGASMIVMISLASYILKEDENKKKQEKKSKSIYKGYWNEKRGEE